MPQGASIVAGRRGDGARAGEGWNVLTMNAARGAGIVVPNFVRAMRENGNGSTKQVKMNAFRSLYGLSLIHI